MLDYGSEDIDGMDDYADEEQSQNPPFIGHPKKLTTMTKKIQLRINLLRHSPNAGVLGAALSHVIQKTAILAPEKIILRTMPKTMKTLLR